MKNNTPGKVVAVEPLQLAAPEEPLKYDENLKPNRPAFKNEKEVWDACCNFYAQNEERNKRDAWLTELYFYKPPYPEKKLVEAGYGWAANVPSGFLAAAVASVTPAFKRAVNGTKYLTNSKLKENDSKKSELFQAKLTLFIRRWQGWQALMDCIIQERTLLGRATTRGVDQYNWRPRFYSTQNALFPEGCSLNVDEIPQIVFVDDWLPNQFIDKIKNIQKAKGAGWNIENCVKVLNAAAPKDDADDRTLATWLADGAYASSYTKQGPVFVSTYTMMAVEPDQGGMISEWVVGKEHGEKLYYKKNKYKSMIDAVTSWTFNQGQNTLHSSRGFGRLLAPVHQMYDRSLCKLLDDLYLSGMRVVHVQEKRKMDWSIMIRSPFVICPVGITSEPMNHTIPVEGFFAAVRQFVGLARQIAGAYSPSTILPEDSTEKTATQATIDAAKEGELREGVLARFAQEMSAMIWFMTKRILDPKTYDEEALAFQKELMETDMFTREELDELAACPPTDHIQNYSVAIRNQKILEFCANNRGNPAYDQRKMDYLLAEVAVDSDFAAEIVIPVADPEMDRQAKHDQELENTVILKLGSKITPGPLDNDLAHLQIACAVTKEFVQGIQLPTQTQGAALVSMGEHISIHIAQAEAKGAKPKDLKPFVQFRDELAKQIELYATRVAQERPESPGSIPVGDPQQAPGPNPPGPTNPVGNQPQLATV